MVVIHPRAGQFFSAPMGQSIQAGTYGAPAVMVPPHAYLVYLVFHLGLAHPVA